MSLFRKLLIFATAFSFFIVLGSGYVYTQSVAEMDREAEEYFKKKDFSKAVALWLNILDIDPDNIDVQKKVEFLYEMKQKKDLELERAKYNYKLAKKELVQNISKNLSDDEALKNLLTSKSYAEVAFSSFITAYRIDSLDSELQLLREDMQRLEQVITSEEKRLKTSIELREKISGFVALAKKAMEEERYKDALENWEAVLKLFPEHSEAIEGKRQALLAIENVIRYENIKKYMASGVDLFSKNELKLARQDFMNVLQLDPENSAAKDYIEKIDDKLNERKRYEQRLKEAENFYLSGIKNLKESRFDDAVDDFENVLTLIPNYKDTKQRLSSIPEMKKEFEKRERDKKLRLIDESFQSGLIALAESRYQDAISAFEKTLTLDPLNKLVPLYIQRAKDAQRLVEEEIVDENSSYFAFVNSLIESGRKLYDSGKYKESKEKWEQILQLFPANKIANEYNFRCELQLKPDQREVMLNRLVSDGEELLKKRDYRGAYRKFQLAMSIDPSYPDIKNLVAKAEKGERFSGTASLSPVDINEIERRFNLGIAYYKKGGEENMRKALAELRWVVSKDPDNVKAVVSVNKIEAQLRIGSSTEKAGTAKLTPEQEKLVRQYYYSGINYYSNNDFKRAIAEWRKVLAIDPNHEKAKNNIRKCLVLLGK
ncbi:MAG TPA: hypothetical protein PLN03_04780 [Spirochaetota bacterium]|nr:hypothetical protein [Spirochaetota bacterium]HRU65225.1 hypothetical protein [Spirochaetota bacterium]